MEKSLVMSREDKLVALLKGRIKLAREEATAFIEKKAAEIAKDCPGIPIGVVINQLTRGACPCEAALHQIDK
jgi:hypothetical protein